MGKAGAAPTIDLGAGRAALDADLPRVLRALDASNLDELGWTRPNALTLVVPLEGRHDSAVDRFTLRLGFHAYPSWPPGAQFVNPATLAYDGAGDRVHVPRLVSPECHTHVDYQKSNGEKIQLICCSATQEFYDVLHPVDPAHEWRDGSTFLTTFFAIQRALKSHYQGRFAPP